ncbi:M16 family metallopeptidase [Domibacillus epiphyticus]|uniref:Peptidase M16 n=1 Tax=Domibacillus epiphyticus TaxID=1714355 RepID=A0A1V2ACH4_9BACI|nr:pitrilysin family protein [Domibacillus epiphyticus]OMP68650.1 peptidase M16 [Domibacillus epiphyticus]
MIKRFTCNNGVTIVTEEISTVRSAAIGIWIATGSRDESPELNGISHFLEHMFFKGTDTLSAKEIAESFDSIGGQVNAFTSKEYTCYYAKVLDNHADHALNVLSDMFFHSKFEEEEMEKEKNVIYEEIKMYEDAPDDIVHDLLSRAAFGNHPLGLPILGTEETLASFTRDTLKDYMYNMYTPDRIVISIAGNIDEEIVRKAEALFGSYTGGKAQSMAAPVHFFHEKKSRSKETEQAHLCLGFEGIPIGDKDIYNLIVMNNIIGGSMSSRLFQEVREERGLAYSVYSYHSSYKDTGLITFYGGTGAGQLDELYETIVNSIKLVKEEGFTEKELYNSKEQLKGSLMLSLESTNSRMSRNGKNELLLKRHRSLDEIVSLIDSVTKDSIDQLGRQLFDKPFSASLISPDGKWPTSATI